MRRFISGLTVCVFMFMNVAPSWAAHTPLWTKALPQAVKWSVVTQSGVLLVGTNTTLSGINPDTGDVLWTREDLKKTAQFNTKEVSGTSILLINDYSGMGTNTRMYAVDMNTGKDIWSTEAEAGYAIGIYPVPSKNLTVLFYRGWNKEEGAGIFMRAYELTTGNKLWDGQFDRGNNPIVLHTVDDAGWMYVKQDLNGHQDPIVVGDNMYVPFNGLDSLDLNTGKLNWEVPFKTGIQLYKKAYAPILIDGDVIYASGYGVIYAIDKNTGAIKWQTKKISSGQIAEVTLADQMLLARVGGFFNQPGNKAGFVLDKPLKVVAYNKTTGEELWDVSKIELGITNLLYLPKEGTVILADGKGVIGLDASSTGKATEKFRIPLKFTRDIGAAEWTAAGTKALTGGIGGLLNAGVKMATSKKERMDIPVNVMLNDEGTVIVRGKQHVMALDSTGQDIKWSNYFSSPGASLFDLGAMVALTAFSTVMYSAGYASGSMSYGSANDGIAKAFGNLDKSASKRFQASQQAPGHSYILTNVDDEGKKGLGILSVNLRTGSADKQFVFGEKQPVYAVDEIEGKLFHFKGKTMLEAYAL